MVIDFGSAVGRVSALRWGSTGDIPKSLTMVQLAPRLALRFFGVGLGLVTTLSE